MSKLKNTLSRLLLLSLIGGGVGIFAPSAHAASFKCPDILSRLLNIVRKPTPLKTKVKYNETVQLIAQFKGEENTSPLGRFKTLYLDKKQREIHRVHFKDGKAYDSNGMQLSKRGSFFSPRRNKGSNDYIYVMDKSGNIYIGVSDPGRFHHSSFLAGDDVVAAGHIAFEKGEVVWVSNVSGHYQPRGKTLDYLLSELNELGIDVSKVEKDIIVRPPPLPQPTPTTESTRSIGASP